MATQNKIIEPHGVNELMIYLALVDSLEEARGYRCLGKA